jgi:UDP-N-acetylglucosamine 2-epimerase (non-hydrolysing)
VTYHPVTLSVEPAEQEFEALLHVLDDYPEHHILFTYPNADHGGYAIIQRLERYCQQNSQRAFAVKSLGYQRYLSAVSHADVVLGNSSSAIIEVPAFGVPAINIGLRQQGRLAADSVLHAESNAESIHEALEHALSPSFREQCRDVVNPYGSGDVASRIISVLKTVDLSVVKYFQDLEFNHESI